ncbi:TPA: hypothetical protein HA344_06985 [Candidatus Bathyarchaeota archaeon]|nr:hypothetical protein [Candidatus Bathyarchaeota archaeon]
MVNLGIFAVAFIVILVVIIVGRNRLPRWARFTLMMAEVIIMFFAIVFVIFG